MALENLVPLTIMGEYEFPGIEMFDSIEWEALCEKAGVCSSYGTPTVDREFDGFENEVFVIRPYDWEEPNQPLPNFHHKPTGFKVWWYKYAFRSSDMNMNLSVDEIREIFRQCVDSLSQEVEPSPSSQVKGYETADELLELLEERIKVIIEYNNQIKMLTQEVNFLMNCDKYYSLSDEEIKRFNELSEENETLMAFNSLKTALAKNLCKSVEAF